MDPSPPPIPPSPVTLQPKPNGRLSHLPRVVLYMLKKALLSRCRSPFLDLQLLLERGKLIGKRAFTTLLHYHSNNNNSCSYRFEFSCSCTPSHVQEGYTEDLNSDVEVVPNGEGEEWRVGSPWWALGRSPVVPVRELRVTDSPFPLVDEEECGDWSVDEEAEAFIERFYEELRRQNLGD